ncbi:MAG: DUF493 domain-containing protein [Bacteroidetes Order II. Incertae sedis bacterium]|jgi:uncharacterized protein|nr:DUF493 domain-containing protein [Bacteroidetes Order II. bacterium]MBT4603819.1 DUF493 domain-containing protein [Bacteroidetes Order II. bacterium]MBT5248973.1 DUF493 domain-containing protein [Bacteroidetes Order II. bacterium]MBT6200944.1 DUF493 domain-containing protein [Bacteroidetes Order II. bacterium]MBT6424023.1 DUF493 domain-containing protein [Bacteroidetes Order II. bacterium]
MAPSKIPSSDNQEWWDDFKNLLEDQYDFPSLYLFKFIAPKEQMADLKEVFIGNDIDVKASSKGKYQSVTSRILVDSSQEIIDIYQRAGSIEGVISL